MSAEFKRWLSEKLEDRQMSINYLTLKTGNQITNATIHRWFSGKHKPSVEKLELICRTLSQFPIKKEGEPPRYEHVSASEAEALFL